MHPGIEIWLLVLHPVPEARDQEIQAAIGAHPASWKRAKLMLLESLCRRFAYEVDTKTGPLSLPPMDSFMPLWMEDM